MLRTPVQPIASCFRDVITKMDHVLPTERLSSKKWDGHTFLILGGAVINNIFTTLYSSQRARVLFDPVRHLRFK